MNKKSIIPIVLTIDKLFIEYACVTIYSLVQNCTLDNDYTIYVFHNGLLEIMKNRLYSIIKNKNNIHLEFKDVTQFIEHHKLKSNLKHVTNATFYRYLIPIILNQYEKILYLDTDIVVITDIANLFNINIDNYYFGACHDLIAIQHIMLNTIPIIYFRDKLKIINPINNYFNAGIMLFNTKKLNEDKIPELMFKLAENNNYLSSGQDPMNAAAKESIKILPQKWNLMTYEVAKNSILSLPKKILEEYTKSKIEPCIIHYAAHIKPWNAPDKSELSEYWWKYANEVLSPEEMLNNFAEGFFKAIKLGLTDYHFSIEQFLLIKQEYKTRIKTLKLKKIFSIGKQKRLINQQLNKLKSIYRDINYIIEIMEVM